MFLPALNKNCNLNCKYYGFGKESRNPKKIVSEMAKNMGIIESELKEVILLKIKVKTQKKQIQL